MDAYREDPNAQSMWEEKYIEQTINELKNPNLKRIRLESDVELKTTHDPGGLKYALHE